MKRTVAVAVLLFISACAQPPAAEVRKVAPAPLEIPKEFDGFTLCADGKPPVPVRSTDGRSVIASCVRGP